MTPETFAVIGGLLDKYGLPISLLIGLGWALLTRRLTLGSETNYVEARRQEERDARLAAEAALREMTGSMTKLSQSVEDLTDTILDSIGDRTEGRRVPRR